MTVRLHACTRVAAFAALLALPLAATAGDVTGKIVDTSGNPIPVTSVSAGGVSAYDDATGVYTLHNVPAGVQQISAGAYLYKTGTARVTVPTSGIVTAPNIVLQSYSGTIVGTVVDAATGQPIAGATVTVAARLLKSTTSSAGAYAIPNVRAGAQSLVIAAAGYTGATVAVTVPSGGAATVNVALVSAAPPTSSIRWNGANWYLYGANLAWYNYGTDFGAGAWGKYTDWNAIDSAFASLAASGAHVVRWWMFADGRYDPLFNASGAVTGIDSTVLANVDQALQLAANHNLYILFTVIDNSIWNPATADKGLTEGGHAALVTNATVQQSFLDNALKPVLQHVAASANKSRVLGYDLVNEPEAQISGCWGGQNFAASQVQTFVKNCASCVHAYGGGAYATVGSATPYYVSMWKGLGLDFYELHYYPWMDFSNGAGSGLPAYSTLALDKPCIVGEYPTVDANYSAGSAAPLSAQWYLDSAFNKGYAGALAWSYSVKDSATDWTDFLPLFANWAQSKLQAASAGGRALGPQ